MKVLKWSAVVLAGLAAILVVAAVILHFKGSGRLLRSYDIHPAALTVEADSATVARGRHLVEAVTLCTGCHGERLEGKVLFDDPSIATIYASNLTGGRGGVGSLYTEVDYARAIRHGVNKDGRGLMIMHSDAYNRLGAEDLAAIIAYVESAPPVDNEVPKTSTAVMGRIFVALGMFDMEAMPLIPAEVIDHEATLPDVPTPDTTAEYGAYLASIALCTMCHGRDLKGGPPIEEGAPPGPNILSYAAPGGWTQDEFVSTIRTGITPAGRSLNGEVMPWETYSRMTDSELIAIRRYMESLAAS